MKKLASVSTMSRKYMTPKLSFSKISTVEVKNNLRLLTCLFNL